MKNTRTKKLRGRKRKEGNQETTATMSRGEKGVAQSTPPRQLEQECSQQNGGAGGQPGEPREPKKTAAHEERQEKNKNVLKTKSARGETTDVSTVNGAAAPDAETERWISLIRQGGLDRSVKVRGKTGALLVR